MHGCVSCAYLKELPRTLFHLILEPIANVPKEYEETMENVMTKFRNHAVRPIVFISTFHSLD